MSLSQFPSPALTPVLHYWEWLGLRDVRKKEILKSQGTIQELMNREKHLTSPWLPQYYWDSVLTSVYRQRIKKIASNWREKIWWLHGLCE